MNPRLPWIVFFLSASLLGYQLALMRILSYTQWYHFAYMIISIALLGFGASGTLLSVARQALRRHPNSVILTSSLLAVISLAGIPFLLPIFHIDPYILVWDPIRLFSLFGLYVLVLIPFLSGALVIGFSFILSPEHINKLYFSNLVGSGIGSIGTVLIMNWLEPSSLPLAMAAIAFPAALFAAMNLEQRRLVWIVSVHLVLAVFFFIGQPPLARSEFKGLSKTLLLPDARITAKATSPLGVVEAVESRALRYAPGMSFNYAGAIPTQVGVFGDGEWIGSIVDMRDSAALRFLMHSTAAFPHAVKKSGCALVLGSGTGTELQLALESGVDSVTGIEMNRAVMDVLEKYRPQLRNIDRREHVGFVVTDARSYIATTTGSYDLIIVPLLEVFTSSASGAHALFENYLFTVEAFQTMLRRLRDDGLLVVNGWMTSPPRSSLKVIATIIKAMKESGIKEAGLCVAGIRSWGTFSFLAKRQPLSEGEIAAVRQFSSEHGFDLIYVPGITAKEVNRYHRLAQPSLYQGTLAFLEGREEAFYKSYIFDVRPAGDEKPYFSHFFRWNSVVQLLEMYSAGQIAFFELGYVFLVVTLAQLALLSFLLILSPLFVLRRSIHPPGSIFRTAMYFGGIGVGYMMIEMLLIQKFILFLGHPVYAVSIITASLLVFSGIGSLASQRIHIRFGTRPSHAIATIVIVAASYSLILPRLLDFLLPLPFPWRVVCSVLIISLLAFPMGFPFPLGLKRIAGTFESLLPWAWGMNGYCSVISASVAVLIAVEFGFVVVLICAVIAYASALGFEQIRLS